jgi:hypothetical protein
MRWMRGSGVAVTLLVAGLVTCLAGCVSDSDVLKKRWGEDGPPTAARPRGGILRATHRPAAVNTRAGYARALAFTCNTWEPKEAGERFDYPSDFIGIGNRFTTADKVAFGIKTGITRSYKQTFRLWDQTKTLVLEREKTFEANATGHIYALQFQAGDIDSGTYEAAWSINDEEVCSSKIVVDEK